MKIYSFKTLCVATTAILVICSCRPGINNKKWYFNEWVYSLPNCVPKSEMYEILGKPSLELSVSDFVKLFKTNEVDNKDVYAISTVMAIKNSYSSYYDFVWPELRSSMHYIPNNSGCNTQVVDSLFRNNIENGNNITTNVYIVVYAEPMMFGDKAEMDSGWIIIVSTNDVILAKALLPIWTMMCKDEYKGTDKWDDARKNK